VETAHATGLGKPPSGCWPAQDTRLPYVQRPSPPCGQCRWRCSPSHRARPPRSPCSAHGCRSPVEPARASGHIPPVRQRGRHPTRRHETGVLRRPAARPRSPAFGGTIRAIPSFRGWLSHPRLQHGADEPRNSHLRTGGPPRRGSPHKPGRRLIGLRRPSERLFRNTQGFPPHNGADARI
jgi:hypothetical protein